MIYNKNMTYQQAIKLLEVEKECISRNELKMCNRKCDKCDLVENTYDLLDAYNIAINCIKEVLERHERS